MEQTNYPGLVLIFTLLVCYILTLVILSRRDLPPTAKAIWALVILFFPAFGAIAFLIGKHKDRRPNRLKGIPRN